MKLRIYFSIFFFFIQCASLTTSVWKPEDDSIKINHVRVLLGIASAEESFRSKGEILVRDANDLIIKKSYDFLSLDPTVLKAPISIAADSGILSYKSSQYRGTIHLIPKDGKVYILNILPLEEYLMGVVPSEVSPSWPMEALKAQAVCARTYVVREMLNKKKFLYDVDTSTNTQVYRGKDKEHKNTNEAILSTEGIILLHNNQPIHSFFHSNAGGYTEDPAHVWGSTLQYLKPVPSDYDKEGDSYSWEERWKPSFVNQSLQDLGLGEIQDIVVINRFPSSRANELEVIGRQGKKTIKAVDFRKKVGATKLKSTRFGIRREDSGDFYVKGLGSGHGVGLSQWGSFGMAKQNFNYREILSHYFYGIQFARIANL